MRQGDLVGGYRLGIPIAEGASAQVFEVLAASGSAMAIKVLREDRAGDDLTAARFAREIRLAQSLSHPGLARLIDHGAGWIAFERLAGSLTDPAERERHGEPAAVLRLMCRLAETLGYLHGRGIAHRDVKPAQVMFRGPEEPVLIDLGIAGLIGGDPLEGAEIVGSPGWMAPEQAQGAPPSPAADVWSLCALGAWLLTGQRPFAGTADDILELRRGGCEPVFNFGTVPAAAGPLVDFLTAGLSPEPTQRPGLRRLTDLGPA